ncbi:hypothetical protein Q0V21_04990 [Paenibacillus sp. 11B]|uniref:hypothetical protein n=1 Tax=Paenibacillus sp. 11B TaxID=3060965 RepID=UPI00264B4C35|nr:hypothetical protein [Paenibacillus sp. 11B]MDN8588123.1 hypothetical protein [Paenibacillus sp. 11B]
MKTKQKLLLCTLFITIGFIFNIFFSTALHGVLSGSISNLTVPSLNTSLASLISSRVHFLLFLCLQGFTLLLSALFFASNNRPYQSKLKQIAPGIETPVVVGQNQHGSARWLQEEEWAHAFDYELLDLHHPFIRQLIQSGYDDLNFRRTDLKEELHHENASSEIYSESEHRG